MSIRTFIDLYEFLRGYDGDLRDWLKVSWEGKDKQESLLRLFAGLGLIIELREYVICKGNFNLAYITPHTGLRDIFKDDNGRIRPLKDTSDSSDLSGFHRQYTDHILITTSKNLERTTAGKLDIEKLYFHLRQYEMLGYNHKLCIVIRKNIKHKLIEHTKQTNGRLINIIKDAIIIDWSNLIRAYDAFREIFNNISIGELLKKEKSAMALKFHQKMSIDKTMDLIGNGYKELLWGHVQRSGKSYIIGGTILEDASDKKECNYLVITTAPKETIQQYMKIFEYIQFDIFNVIHLNGETIETAEETISDKNIIICSKQFLQSKLSNRGNKKYIRWLKDMRFDMRFLDESHNGGTTQLAKDTLNFYGGEAITIQITATYSKPVNDYDIPREAWVLWDLEDITFCQNIDEKVISKKMGKMIRKHGPIFVETMRSYSLDGIIEEYKKYPKLWILTESIDADVIDVIRRGENPYAKHYGYSLDGCFQLNQSNDNGNVAYVNRFQNEEAVLDVWGRIFGVYDEQGHPTIYPDSVVYMKRIETICKRVNSRCMKNMKEPMIIMVFLPTNAINVLSDALIDLFRERQYLMDYVIEKINSKSGTDPKMLIENSRARAINLKKRGVIILSGRQASLGITIRTCDIVILLNNTQSFDTIYQMMFRCMTEEPNKKCGFVIDLNIGRVIRTSVIQYAELIKPSLHHREAIKYLLEERLITINGDKWRPEFGYLDRRLSEYANAIYETYSADAGNALTHILDRLKFKKLLLSGNEQKLLNALFVCAGNKRREEIIEQLYEAERIEKGIERKEIEQKETERKEDNENEDKKKELNFMEMLRHMIPIICLLTINDGSQTLIDMYNFIVENELLCDLFIGQLQKWWPEFDGEFLEHFVRMYLKYMGGDREMRNIIETIKELFVKNVSNTRELSKLIDKYLIPQELERKQNAEISTPYRLRQEMLDIIPTEFWKTPHKVFEPCCGKGGFVIDIIERFMKGLDIADEKEKYKTILEECLYFADINEMNIYIVKLLVDPHGEYKLNYYCGDTLQLDIYDEWKLDGFDAVIGNPPYNMNENIATGHTIWQHFTRKALDIWLVNAGYLLFVHPSGWRKPNTIRGKFYGMYELMTGENRMIYLSIHGSKDGMKIFKCGTRYDWYLIRKSSEVILTSINDEEGKNMLIDISKYNWLPNYNIDLVSRILKNDNEGNCRIIYNTAFYGSCKNHVSKKQTDEFKYPLIHSTTQKGIRYMYSSRNDLGFFGVSKIIFGDSGINDVIIDMNGEYGMTEHAMGIEVEDLEEAENLRNVLLCDEFKRILKSCIWGNFQIDWRLFTYFKRDFWREFI